MAPQNELRQYLKLKDLTRSLLNGILEQPMNIPSSMIPTYGGLAAALLDLDAISSFLTTDERRDYEQYLIKPFDAWRKRMNLPGVCLSCPSSSPRVVGGRPLELKKYDKYMHALGLGDDSDWKSALTQLLVDGVPPVTAANTIHVQFRVPLQKIMDYLPIAVKDANATYDWDTARQRPLY